jgi:hypothetical protein
VKQQHIVPERGNFHDLGMVHSCTPSSSPAPPPGDRGFVRSSPCDLRPEHPPARARCTEWQCPAWAGGVAGGAINLHGEMSRPRDAPLPTRPRLEQSKIHEVSADTITNDPGVRYGDGQPTLQVVVLARPDRMRVDRSTLPSTRIRCDERSHKPCRIRHRAHRGSSTPRWEPSHPRHRVGARYTTWRA